MDQFRKTIDAANLCREFVNAWWPLVRTPLAIALLIYFGWRAAEWVGYLFGFVIGASLSPMGTVVAPLLFSLLAVIGLAVGAWQNGPRTTTDYFRLAIVAAGVLVFGQWCDFGLREGTDIRMRYEHEEKITLKMDTATNRPAATMSGQPPGQ